jgi:nucleolar protein 4
MDKTEQPSRGYGFVEFATHAHALAALRWTNNNPVFSKEAQGGGKGGTDLSTAPRLLVEFAVENRSKLQMQERRREVGDKRSAEQRKLMADEAIVPKKKMNKDKMSRGQLQREKRRQQRLRDEGGGSETKAAVAPVVYPVATAAADRPGPKAKKARFDADDGTQKGAKRGRGEAREADDTLVAEEAPTEGRKKKAKAKPKDDLAALVSEYKAKLVGGGVGEASDKFKATSARWFV